MDLKNTGKAFMSIHDAFFSLDKSKKLARIDLEFPAPSAIFSSTVHAGIPMLNEDFENLGGTMRRGRTNGTARLPPPKETAAGLSLCFSRLFFL